MSNNMVDHPNHYQTKSGIETIDVMKAFTEDLKGAEAVDTSQILKYVCRWKQKNGLEDLKKAQWYLNDLIEEVSKPENQGQAEAEPSVEESVKNSFNRWLECESQVHNLDPDHFGSILWEAMFGKQKPTYPAPKEPVYRVLGITFETPQVAYTILDLLKDMINVQGYVTIDSYYRASDIHESFIADLDFLYGWLSLDTVTVVPTDQGWVIDLPKPIKIHEKKESK